MSYIKKGDCLELLKEIPDKSVNLVLMDPPYNIKKEKGWDNFKTVEKYVEFMGEVFKECERVLVDNGAMYFFHNDFEQMTELQHWIKNNTGFIFNSLINLDKGDFRALAWKNPTDDNKLRSWFNTCEYCLYYVKIGGVFNQWNDSPSNIAAQQTVKKYLLEQLSLCGKTKTELNKFFYDKGYTGTKTSPKPPDIVSHFFGDNNQNCMPTEQNYLRLREATENKYFLKEYESLRQEYESLRQEYESLRYIHHLDPNHNNVWKFKRDKGPNYHSCQKPLDILERIINCSSNPGHIVLDPFVGSGSTCVAAINTGREYIGFEREDKYFEIAEQRIKEAEEAKKAP